MRDSLPFPRKFPKLWLWVKKRIFLPIFFLLEMSSFVLGVWNWKPISDMHIDFGFTRFLNNWFWIKHFVIEICLTWFSVWLYCLKGLWTVTREQPTDLATPNKTGQVANTPIVLSRSFWCWHVLFSIGISLFSLHCLKDYRIMCLHIEISNMLIFQTRKQCYTFYPCCSFAQHCHVGVLLGERSSYTSTFWRKK